MPLVACNWRSMIFFAILTAQKIYDEAYISNTEYHYVYPFFETNQIACLENKFLELMKYNTIIKFSTYTKYYLELKTLLPEEDILKPLDQLSFKSFEKHSKILQEKFKTRSKTGPNNKEAGESTVFVIN